MYRIALDELIRNGVNSGVEFKRDDIHPEQLGKEMAALLNLEGGYILLGVEDDQTITGLTQTPKQAEEWVMQCAKDNVHPATIPYWETIEWCEGQWVGIVSLTANAPDKPYKAKRGSSWVTQIRVGTTTRDATNPEEMRLYQQSGQLRYDHLPVPGASLDDLDARYLINYFRDMRRQEYLPWDDREAWLRFLVNTGLMVENRERIVPTAGGILLFGRRPHLFLPQASINAEAYPGIVKDYNARARTTLRGPAVALFPAMREVHGARYPDTPWTFSDSSEVLATGIIEQALDFVRRNIEVTTRVDDSGRRQERWDYPLDVVREAVVNAVVHRDYAIRVCDIELTLYANRLEIISPGRLPNTVTVPKMLAGYRATRNSLLMNVLRDYRYIEGGGLGVPRKILAGMRQHNGTAPELIEEEDHFLVRLWK